MDAFDWDREPRYLVRTLWGYVKDWDAHDRTIFTPHRDDAFEWQGSSAMQSATAEANHIGGIIVASFKELV